MFSDSMRRQCCHVLENLGANQTNVSAIKPTMGVHLMYLQAFVQPTACLAPMGDHVVHVLQQTVVVFEHAVAAIAFDRFDFVASLDGFGLLLFQFLAVLRGGQRFQPPARSFRAMAGVGARLSHGREFSLTR